MNKQDHNIISLKLGMTNCYLIRGGGNYVMVDAGPLNALGKRQKVSWHIQVCFIREHPHTGASELPDMV